MGAAGAGSGLVFCEKILDIQLSEIGQGAAERLVVPIPPRQLREPAGNGLGEPSPDRPRGIASDNGIGGNILGHDAACGDHGACSDIAARQYDCALSDPDIMANIDAMPPPPVEQLGLL